MENLERAGQTGPIPGHAEDRFHRIREMIELPEENVSATFAPREAEDDGLPLMLVPYYRHRGFLCRCNDFIVFHDGPAGSKYYARQPFFALVLSYQSLVVSR